MRAVLFLLLALPLLADADVYKCSVNNRTIYSAEPCGPNAALVRVNAGDLSAHSVALKLDPSGRFAGSASVGGVPVHFVADTGASHTAISARVASAAGFRECRPSGVAATANGYTYACSINVDLDIGGIVFRSYPVVVLQNFAGDMLLGMDVLRQMRVEQNAWTMVLAR